MESFASIKLARWRQFEEVDLDLSSHLTVLTGPNGCGKTTILNVLGRHFGWSLQFLASSSLSERERKRLNADAWDVADVDAPGRSRVGSIRYSSGSVSNLTLTASDNVQYQLEHNSQRQVFGVHIPSHRPPPNYTRIKEVPIDPKTSQQHFQAYQSFLFATYGEQPTKKNPASAMKESLIAFAVFGEGNSSVRANPEYKEIFYGFQENLRKLLPTTIGFESLEVRTPNVILRTKSGDFPLEAMSGGLNALFGIAWQIHMYGFDKEACTVLIDEPENHLHPSMQREFLPRLSAAFPTYKFVVSTHSPFIVSSKPDAAVYALTYNERQRVISSRLREVDLSGSPNKVLREILDVPVTMPLWVENRIELVLSKFRGVAIDAETIASIRRELDEQGLGDALGDFLVQRTDEGT